MEFTFGSDPEFMLTKSGRYYSAIGVVQGDREHRINILGHEFYYDNVLAEAAIRPGKTRKEVVDNFREAFRLYASLVKPHKLTIQAAHDYPDSQMTHKEAREVGCNQEWNAYTMKVIDLPKKVIRKTNFRTAGGHIHLGGAGPLQNGWEKPFVIYMLDLFLGIPSLFMDKDRTSKDRRTLYGSAGSHRDTPYGLEYRPLGPFWLESPRKVELIWDICDFVLSFVDKGHYKKFWDFKEEMLDEEDTSLAYYCGGYDKHALQEAINTCDKKTGRTFMIFAEQYLPDDLVRRIHEEGESESGNFYDEWGID